MTVQLADDARAVVLVAQDAARRLGHRWIGTEHLLFALAATEQPIGVLLRAAGVEPRPIWAGIVSLVAVGDRAVDWDALSAIGIDLDRVRAQVPGTPGAPTRKGRSASGALRRRTRRRRGHIPLNTTARRCVEDAGRSGAIGSRRLALAVVEAAGPAARTILFDLGVSGPMIAALIEGEVTG